MKNRYPQTWSELLANSDHLLVLGVNDLDTAQYVSQLTGTTTISIVGTGNTEGSTGGSNSLSRTYTGRPLLTPDEIRRLPNDEALLLPKANYPAKVAKVDYTLHNLASSIEEEDPHAYQAPDHDPPTAIDVDLILASLMPKDEAEQPDWGPAPADDVEVDVDLTQFTDDGPKHKGG
jgi:type IV secretory pathway TraG/TraD family ATPase VirD4